MSKIEKIVLFTANRSGGIVQLTEQLADTLLDEGIECVCYYPEGTKVSRTSLANQFYSLSPYEHLYSKNVSEVTKRIVKENASYIWFTDSPLMSLLVLCKLKNKCKTILTVHDLITHPTNNTKLIYSLYLRYSAFYKKLALKHTNKVLLLSPNSLSMFNTMYTNYANKSILLHLGAHIPIDDFIIPEEIQMLDTYHLFFGVIDKYKGINNLIDSFNATQKHIPLVIAGKGALTPDEKMKIERSSCVYLINRYISNGEMKWLISHAKSVVLPYIEASQSGVLPISYYFGIPVVVSDLPGLKQYVDQGKTGFVCKNNREISNALDMLSNCDISGFSDNAKKYYNELLEWHENVSRVVNKLEETD